MTTANPNFCYEAQRTCAYFAAEVEDSMKSADGVCRDWAEEVAIETCRQGRELNNGNLPLTECGIVIAYAQVSTTNADILERMGEQ